MSHRGYFNYDERVEITDLLRRAHAGDSDALNSVIPLVYNELRRLAANYLHREQGPLTIQATALVHEAYLRIAASPLPAYENRAHFYGIAARVMRQVLVDMARARAAEKRGPGLEVTVADLDVLGAPAGNDFLALNDALDRLSSVNARKAQLIELRFFGGMTAEESAEVLEIPVHTVRRELRVAQAWLRRELAS